MSTRGAIARSAGDSFVGRYHHFDSYPAGLGQTLWNLYHGYFQQDLQQMLKVLLDDHPAGWSSIIGTNFDLAPGYGSGPHTRPQCYCHGDRNEKPLAVTEQNAAKIGCEWVYVFDEASRTMSVFYPINSDGSKMVGAFGFGNPTAKCRVVASFSLDGLEPDWYWETAHGAK